MTILQKIRSSFTTQLALWVGIFVVTISGIVILLLVRFSQGVLKEESIETTRQALVNTALRIDNALRLADMTARLERQSFRIDKALIEKMMKENNYLMNLNQWLPHAQVQVTDQPVKGQKSGYQQLLRQDELSYIFYEPIYGNQFYIIITCPATDIYGRFTSVHGLPMAVTFFGLLILLFICWKVIAWHLRPLHLLADSAQRIADGQLYEAIPDTRQKDEGGQLQNSLSKMQRSLASYMEEMQQKQDTLSRQNAELQESYSKAQEYENLKAKFLHQMTEKIVSPVETISKLTDTIGKDYQTLTKAEMTKIQTDIISATEDVTQLLDQLLNVPGQSQAYPSKTNPQTNDAP